MKAELKYGIYLGLSICVWKLVEFTFGFHGEYYEIGKYTDFLPLLLLIAALFLGIKERRDESLNGYIDYKQGVRTGFFISLVSSIISVTFIYFYYKVINPGYIDYIIAANETRLLAEGKSPDAVAAAVVMVKNTFRASNVMLQHLLFNLLGGALISLIIALVLKREKPPPDAENPNREHRE
jgi:hypothetical protein